MLDKFKKAKMGEISALSMLEQDGALPSPFSGQRRNFIDSLTAAKTALPVIAEFKRASPSRGLICAEIEVEEAAREYAPLAGAISILTEETYFDGKLEFLNRAHAAVNGSIPLLRKDFIFNPLQIIATAATPASAILLITRLLPDAETLQSLLELASGYGLASVVEIFDEEDLKLARNAGAKIIQANARDLQTLKVNRQNALDLIRRHRPNEDEFWIFASGISLPQHLHDAKDAGYDAALVGGSLMENGQPGAALKQLLELKNVD